jgi:hypothetical protein
VKSSEVQTATFADLGVSSGQPQRWQKLAEVPEKDFEAALAAAG